MAEPIAAPAANIEALIEGQVSGQIAVGNYNLQVVADHGAVVNIARPEERPKPRLRPSPILLRPRPFRGLLDRKEPVESAVSALREGLPVELCGPAGIGKSALLRYLAYAVPADGWPDGFVYLAAGPRAAADLLQALFEAFYECDSPFKPTEVQIRQLLQGRQALVLVDDLELDRQGVEELLNAAPSCAFLLISRERCLWGEGRALALAGLPPEDAVALFERELDRKLGPDERAAATKLCERLGGSPLGILQAAVRVKEENRSIRDESLRDVGPVPAALPDAEKRVLSVLAALGGGPVGAAHLAALTGAPDLETLVQDLQQRRLVQAHSPRYSLTGDLRADLARSEDLEPWREKALAYFTEWAEKNRRQTALLLEELGTLRRLLRWAVRTDRWDAAQRLARALEGALLLGGLWSAWAETLEAVRQAAQTQGNAAAEGWSLHQLGTRLLCLDDKPAAKSLLTRALEIREKLGDRTGAAITRHNLGLIAPPPPSSPQKPGPGNLRFLPWAIPPLAVLVGVGIWLSQPKPVPPPPPQDPPVQPVPGPSPRPRPVPPPLTSDHGGTSDVVPPTTDVGGDSSAKPSPAYLDNVPWRIQFPDVEIGGPPVPPQSTKIINLGKLPLHVERIAFEKNPTGAFTVDSGCEGKEIVSEGCEVAVSFSPQKPGRYEAVFSIQASGQRRMVLVVGAARMADAATGQEQTPALSGEAGATARKGWCCIPKYPPFVAMDVDCKEKRGRFFEDQNEAQRFCGPGQGPTEMGCCLDGAFRTDLSREDCAQRRGRFMTKPDALKLCKASQETEKPPPPPEKTSPILKKSKALVQVLGYCCHGTVSRTTPEACAHGGGFFSYKKEEADARCTPIQ